jgi:signal transduction histidine kinase
MTDPEQGPEATGDRDSLEGLQSALIEAGVLLAAELSLPTLLRRLVEIAVRITGARYGALGVIGPGGGIVEFISVGLDDRQRAAIGHIPRGRGILGALIHDPKPLRLVRLQDDPRSVGFPPNHPPMTSFLGAPVRARGQVFGNLYLTEKKDGQPFNAADESAVTILANQAGVAVANAQTHRGLLQRERWLEALHEVTEGLVSGEPNDQLMNRIVRSARSLAGADLAAIAIVAPEGSTTLRVVAADGLGADEVLNAPDRESGTPSHRVLATGQATTVRPEQTELPATLVGAASIPVTALMVVPLVVGGKAAGTISLTWSQDDADFGSEALSLLESFASQASVVLDYSRVQEQALRWAVVEERNRIARDLHDEPVQALIYLARRLERMAADSASQQASVAQLEETRELAVAVVDGLRQLTEGLRSEILEQEGLAAALLDLSKRFTSRTAIAAEFSSRRASGRWSPELERNLLRLTQEALSNVERHASASRVMVTLTLRPGRLTLRVADDGVGYITSGDHAVRPGLGTIGMQERVAQHRGWLMIRSRPGRGTVLVANMPIDQSAPGNADQSS